MKSRIRAFNKSFVAAISTIVLLVGLTPVASAVDQRTVDIVELTWPGAARPSASVADVQRSLNKVRTDWLNFTTLEGTDNTSAIEFVYGRSLNAPLELTAKFECEAQNFTSFVNSVRAEFYKRLGITDPKSRYLTILIPNAGCIWMGRALIGDIKVKGGAMVLHNTANPFVITHELGHSLGLGHTNLLRCESGANDGPWSSDCRGVEYGGSVDVMGNVDTKSTLSVYHQWRMGLLTNSEVHQSWLSEQITLTASDVKSGIRAVFLRDGKSSYWLEYRRPKEGVSYKPGIVIYRSDPPTTQFVESPNPIDVNEYPVGVGVSTDIWMLNLADYVYSPTGRATGSMTLNDGNSVSLHSKNVTVSFKPGKDANSVILEIARKADNTPPPTPVFSETQFWQFPDFPVLQNGYADAESEISHYEIKRDEEISRLDPEAEPNFFPTYLSPLKETPVLKIRDLPEGKYVLQVRAVDVWGNVSPWSSARNLSIDRGAPNLSSGLRIVDADAKSAQVKLNELRDPGSGLCETVLINPEGFVVARSAQSSAPEFAFNSVTLSANKIQVFDCLGNGRQASVTASYTFFGTQDFRRIGKWKNSPTNPDALQCVGKCSAYISTDGSVQAAIGSGSASISVGAKELTQVKYSARSEMRLSDPVSIGKVKRSVKISGQNFTLYGAAKANMQLGPITNVRRVLHPEDLSLKDEKQLQLANYGFRASDFEQGWFVLPMGGGTTLNDPTLDFCKSKYQSDEQRAERRQVAVTKVGSPYLFLSSEVVRYKSELAAQAAYKELLDTAKKCLSDGGGLEQSDLFNKYKFHPLPGTNEPYLLRNQGFFVQTTIGEASSARTLLAFYQFNGSLFTGLYVVIMGDKPIAENEITRWSSAATLLMERLKLSN